MRPHAERGDEDDHPVRAGFTLIEMLVVISALGVVLALITITLFGALRAEDLAGGVSRRLAQQGTLADDFRADVGRATDAPDSWDRWVAGPACLILRMPDDSHVVYRWTSGSLKRHLVTDSARSVHPLPLGDDNATAEFARGGPGNRVLTVRVSEPRPGGVPRQLDISAALGGDSR